MCFSHSILWAECVLPMLIRTDIHESWLCSSCVSLRSQQLEKCFLFCCFIDIWSWWKLKRHQRDSILPLDEQNFLLIFLSTIQPKICLIDKMLIEPDDLRFSFIHITSIRWCIRCKMNESGEASLPWLHFTLRAHRRMLANSWSSIRTANQYDAITSESNDD